MSVRALQPPNTLPTSRFSMAVNVERDDFASLVDPNAELTLLASGYVFTEGPVWNVKEQALYYSDIPGDRRFRWTEGSGAELIMHEKS